MREWTARESPAGRGCGENADRTVLLAERSGFEFSDLCVPADQSARCEMFAGGVQRNIPAYMGLSYMAASFYTEMRYQGS